MSRVLNVAVIGLGIGRAHIAEGYAKHADKFRVLAICDLDAKRLAAVGDEFDVPRRTADFDAVLGMADIDVVDICTPPGLHVPQTLAAIAAGKHAICEKPLAGSLADVDKLIAAQRKTKRRIMPVFQYRFGNGLQKAKRIVDLGLAGKPYLATIETAWKRAAAYYAVPWRGKWGTELGGVLLTQAIHSHDIMTYLMGPIATVFARTATRVNPIEVEDCAVASLLMKSGALVSLAATLGSQREISRLRFCFEYVTFESAQAPYSPGDDPWEIIPATPEAAKRIDGALADWRFVPSRYEGLFPAFHSAILDGAPLPVTLADARQSLELVTALMHSAETGKSVDLPIGAKHPKYRSWRPRKQPARRRRGQRAAGRR
jgi:predicted dehydrogenase